MSQEPKKILKRIGELISLIENSNVRTEDKLKILKVLLILKIKLIDLLPLAARSDKNGKSGISNSPLRQRENTLEKQALIVNFLKEKGGRAGSTEFINLGMAGRSLRRYLKNLRDTGKLSLDKKGREHFYNLIKI